VGKSGLEKSYEEVLRGVKGVKNLYVDNLNNPKGSYMDGQYDTTAVPGKNITCTIDLNLQEYGEQLMVNKKGGIVAIEPKTGEILAMVSSPTYDPNLLVGRGFVKIIRFYCRTKTCLCLTVPIWTDTHPALRSNC